MLSVLLAARVNQLSRFSLVLTSHNSDNDWTTFLMDCLAWHGSTTAALPPVQLKDSRALACTHLKRRSLQAVFSGRPSVVDRKSCDATSVKFRALVCLMLLEITSSHSVFKQTLAKRFRSLLSVSRVHCNP